MKNICKNCGKSTRGFFGYDWGVNSCSIDCSVKWSDENRKKSKLRSLSFLERDTYSGSMSGSGSFLGHSVSGSFSGGMKPYYYYYKENEKGGVMFCKIAAEKALIFEDEEAEPYCLERTESLYRDIFPGVILHIPKSSIINKISVNLPIKDEATQNL